MSDRDLIAPARHGWADPQNWGFHIGAQFVALARNAEDMKLVQDLRAIRFRGASGLEDADAFDPLCHHLLIRTCAGQKALATARVRRLPGAVDIQSSYSAQFYDLSALARSALCCLEIGRICIAASHLEDPDVLRALLAGLARLARDAQADILMGCASFKGSDPERHMPALAYLGARHLGPAAMRPTRKAMAVIELPEAIEAGQMAGLRQVPALLRLYLGLGGWVSDHAVIDTDLNTLHVFTAVEIAAIPAARLQVLQGLTQGCASR